MPKKAKRQCIVAGCPDLADVGIRCPKHTKEFEKNRPNYNRYIENQSSNLYDARWQKYRITFLRQHPICSCGQPATIVDHIIDHLGNIELFWRRENHQALCETCHNKKTWKTTLNPNKQVEVEKMLKDRDELLKIKREYDIT